MLKITDDLRNPMKILTTKMPYLRKKKVEQYIKLYTDTFEQHGALNNFLDNVKFPHYTITPKTQRPIKVVIKGLPRDTKPFDISNDLTVLGVSVDRVTQLKGNISKQLLPIFLITLPRNLTNAKIFDLKTLSHLSITVDGLNRKGATQCFKCNLFNHTAENCHLAPRCLQCGNEHQTRECQIVKVDTLFCINCETYGQLANYSKCPLYPKPRKDTITQTNYTTTVSSIVRPNITFAQVAKTNHSTTPQQMAAPATLAHANINQDIQNKTEQFPIPLSGNNQQNECFAIITQTLQQTIKALSPLVQQISLLNTPAPEPPSHKGNSKQERKEELIKLFTAAKKNEFKIRLHK
ncbi:nucleic-acid-binding protein from transposon X-element [Trichonephila clavipes]|nr:nucleic-acid-binding protein from transposon X-element [Trichonephila clavipes]